MIAHNRVPLVEQEVPTRVGHWTFSRTSGPDSYSSSTFNLNSSGPSELTIRGEEDSLINARPTPDPDFGEQLAAARRGEDWAWHRLYTELIGPITGYLLSRGADAPDDLAAETFLHVARNIESFDGDEDSFRSWVFVIAHRRLIDARRAANRRPQIADRAEEDRQGGDVEEEAIDRLGNDKVQELLDYLTEDQREVLALRVVADLSLKETARITGRDVGAVKALQRRAIQRLQRVVETGTVTQ